MQMQENTISADTSSAIKSDGRPKVYVLSSLLPTLQLYLFPSVRSDRHRGDYF